ncbi:ABC transporter permease [Nocardioides gansuensis]|uniref:ABC transporter permease n=1 Tax=Nocardioides gansuensis TaxID=2138300 RepID=A0A2T8F5T0_9ACTN|nr:ABC transporter permease [Nocardioides gansuensis]PVG81065.1 ABC transporter permease [Nocardioides gansuensis]
MTALADEPVQIELDHDDAVPFSRLVSVELRKMRDTRSGFWLLLLTGVLLVAAAAIALLVTLLNDIELTPVTLAQIMMVPFSLLLPVLAITSVTSEWSQRTGLVTFALEPHRMRAIAAKLVMVLLLALATTVLGFAVGAVTNALYGALGDTPADWSLDASALSWTLITQLLYFLMAFGFGLVLLSTPAAVAMFYVVAMLLPFMVYGPLFGLVSWGPDVVPWLDLGFATTPLAGGEAADVTVYAQVAVTSLVWVALPLVGGLMRVRQAELK